MCQILHPLKISARVRKNMISSTNEGLCLCKEEVTAIVDTLMYSHTRIYRDRKLFFNFCVLAGEICLFTSKCEEHTLDHSRQTYYQNFLNCLHSILGKIKVYTTFKCLTLTKFSFDFLSSSCLNASVRNGHHFMKKLTVHKVMCSLWPACLSVG